MDSFRPQIWQTFHFVGWISRMTLAYTPGFTSNPSSRAFASHQAILARPILVFFVVIQPQVPSAFFVIGRPW